MSEMNNLGATSIPVSELDEVTDLYRDMMEKAKVEDFTDIIQTQSFIQVGTDTDGSPCFLITAANLPIGKPGLEKLLRYICVTLEPIVKGSQYVLIYSHHLLRAESTPEKSWLTSTYQMLPRNYKKNLKHFYIVHPSTWLRVMFMAMSPFLSEKVWRNKLVYIDYLQEIPDSLDRGLIKSKLPEAVKEFDDELVSKPEVAEQVMSTMETLGKELLSAFATPSLLGGSDPAKWN